MLRPHGYLSISAARPEDCAERDTITCAHCGKIVVVKPRSAATVYLIPRINGTWIEEPGAGCYSCAKPVCLPCHDIGACRPLEQWLDLYEAIHRHG